ncbi:ActS/PrrB/RegB family redox-sensitive histidine kinase [Breoghania sp.]|uniref:ActS/PrrB/RegB family redox-sensitive histidine kinase n=1 Tax=Breoghania sp. TaxID=2065378 RepID=UPI002631358D|nr:ActS/PrrB/RegB family redox-sensitive histidine kinase [Breoghania sp.]MDJ0930340.1 ActS/PrrB/RegB family redox-sensitive histidine kinase [Breoghania sp.]
MFGTAPARNDFGERLLKLDTLVRLRWLVIAGQTAAVLVVNYGFGFKVPLGLVFALIALLAWLNLFLKLVRAKVQRLPQRWAAVLLCYNVLQLSGLLFMTGGLGNPFSLLLLVPVTVSAAALPPRDTVALGGVVVIAASLLAFYQLPLPWQEGEVFELLGIYQFGVWTALVAILAILAFYTFQVAAEARQLSQALVATELTLEREQHLHALDGLAAAAAHELGTPLATIVLTAKELEMDLPEGSSQREDVTLIRSQGDRCREILRKLTSLSSDQSFLSLRLSHLVKEVADPHRAFGVTITIIKESDEGEPTVRRNASILYGLGNLLENAVDFASSAVSVRLNWSDANVSVTIADDGPGFADEVIDRIGEPYVTTRARSRARPTEVAAQANAGGLGLGFFIAKTLLECTSARLSLRNSLEGGAVVQIVWPRIALESAEDSAAATEEVRFA